MYQAKVRDVVQHQQLRSKSGTKPLLCPYARPTKSTVLTLRMLLPDDSRDPSEAEGGAIAPLEVPDEMRCYAQVRPLLVLG